jgi:hypothetical protein
VYGREPRYCRIALTKLVESLISFMVCSKVSLWQ